MVVGVSAVGLAGEPVPRHQALAEIFVKASLADAIVTFGDPLIDFNRLLPSRESRKTHIYPVKNVV